MWDPAGSVGTPMLVTEHGVPQVGRGLGKAGAGKPVSALGSTGPPLKYPELY